MRAASRSVKLMLWLPWPYIQVASSCGSHFPDLQGHFLPPSRAQGLNNASHSDVVVCRWYLCCGPFRNRCIIHINIYIYYIYYIYYILYILYIYIIWLSFLGKGELEAAPAAMRGNRHSVCILNSPSVSFWCNTFLVLFAMTTGKY